MNYSVDLRLPEGWSMTSESYREESGFDVSHIEASLKGSERFVDIYVGDMPEGETAEDQAFANYAETVGFSKDDPEDYNPIFKLKFNGKTAWAFDGLCDDNTPMRFIAQEVRKGILAIAVFGAEDDASLLELQSQLERGLRVTTT